MFAVEARNVKKTYQISDGNELEAIRGISFQVNEGECVGIVGESGSGKSTLLHLIGTLDSATSGEILIKGKNPFSGNDKTISEFRNLHIGFVFQQNNLLPEFNAVENVMLPALIANKEAAAVRKKALSLLDRVGLSKRHSHYPSQLSGGEQQRVAIARAVINDPVLILADEPSGSLDSKNAQDVHELFLDLNKTLRATILIVTHNKDLATSLPRKIFLKDGLIVSDERFSL